MVIQRYAKLTNREDIYNHLIHRTENPAIICALIRKYRDVSFVKTLNKEIISVVKEVFYDDIPKKITQYIAKHCNSEYAIFLGLKYFISHDLIKFNNISVADEFMRRMPLIYSTETRLEYINLCLARNNSILLSRLLTTKIAKDLMKGPAKYSAEVIYALLKKTNDEKFIMKHYKKIGGTSIRTSKLLINSRCLKNVVKLMKYDFKRGLEVEKNSPHRACFEIIFKLAHVHFHVSIDRFSRKTIQREIYPLYIGDYSFIKRYSHRSLLNIFERTYIPPDLFCLKDIEDLIRMKKWRYVRSIIECYKEKQLSYLDSLLIKKIDVTEVKINCVDVYRLKKYNLIDICSGLDKSNPDILSYFISRGRIPDITVYYKTILQNMQLFLHHGPIMHHFTDFMSNNQKHLYEYICKKINRSYPADIIIYCKL